MMQLSSDKIQDRILNIRNVQVMIDRDLAELYQVKTKVLNQAVKRNSERFPDNFMFQLNDSERQELVTNCDRFESLKHSSSNPYAFTEQGVSMLSAVLNSDIAIAVSIQIINAFVKIRNFIALNHGLFQRLEKVERKQIESDEKFEKVFKALENKNIQKNKGIFFDGQIFDAWHFVSDLIRSADKSIILVDNYIDDRVLSLLTKKNHGVSVNIYTKNMTRKLKDDVEKFNEQYGGLILKHFSRSHDRFIMIDEKELYHIGASLKDLGKKWFAFSKLDEALINILAELKKADDENKNY